MTMKKIMFNDRCGLTQAVIEGRKTMTRRIIGEKLLKEAFDYVVRNAKEDWDDEREEREGEVFLLSRAPYKVGDVLAVAESYHSLNKRGYLAPEWLDHTCESSHGYENKMFVRAELMPHRIRITNVRMGRLRDISDEDCLKEGIYEVPYCNYSWTDNDLLLLYVTPREAFAALIDKVTGKRTWESNPFCYAYEFKLVE